MGQVHRGIRLGKCQNLFEPSQALVCGQQLQFSITLSQCLRNLCGKKHLPPMNSWLVGGRRSNTPSWNSELEIMGARAMTSARLRKGRGAFPFWCPCLPSPGEDYEIPALSVLHSDWRTTSAQLSSLLLRATWGEHLTQW